MTSYYIAFAEDPAYIISNPFDTYDEAANAIRQLIIDNESSLIGNMTESDAERYISERGRRYIVVELNDSPNEGEGMVFTGLPTHIRNSIARLNMLLNMASHIDDEIEQWLSDQGVECPFDELSYSDGVRWPAFGTSEKAVLNVLDRR